MEEVKFENKFAPVALVVVLDSDVKKQLPKVMRVTSKMRNQFIDIYASYALSYYVGMFSPYFLHNVIARMALPYTVAFSNIPGLIKPIENQGRKSIKMQTYFVPLGPIGLSFTCVSYCDYFKVLCTVDEAVMKEP